MHEFFRPTVSMDVVFPIGVMTQDEHGVIYRSIPEAQVPEDVDRAFYGLDTREQFMNEDFLGRFEVPTVDGGTFELIEPTDERFLEILQARGAHHFLYGPIEEAAGTADEAATREAERLADKDARRELALRFIDPTTRAAIEAYA